MIFEEIRQFLGSQNFALVSTNVPDICVLRNMDGWQTIFCVIVDNTRTRIYSASQLQTVASQLAAQSSAFGNSAYGASDNDILFIVVTGDTVRDRALTQTNLRVWLADTYTKSLIIYENQPADFFGLRDGIESAVSSSEDGSSYGAYGSTARTGTGSLRSVLRKNFPIVTVVLIALNVLYYLVTAALGSTQNMSYMLTMGANNGIMIFEHFQLWRLVSCMFLHFGLSHLASNMIYLGICGYNLEKITGHIRFLLIYMLSGIGSSVVSAAYYYMTGQTVVSAGASGAVYGLVGAISYLTFRNFRTMRPTNLFWRIGAIIIFVFYSSFTRGNVDGAAHIGGFVFGLILGFCLIRPRIRNRS